MLLPLAYCKLCSYESVYTNISSTSRLCLQLHILDIYSEIGILDYMVVLFFIFEENVILFSLAIAPFYSLTKVPISSHSL